MPGLGQLEISDDVTITGLGAGTLTVDAGGNSRVLRITAGTVDISGLTLTGGSVGRGGGIRNEAAAITTLTGMVISGNTATTTNTDAGGGLWNTGDLTLLQTTVSNNSAPNGDASGGGIFNDNLLTITGSTISGNTASFTGGAITSFNPGVVNVTDSTFAGNQANRGGAIASGGELNIDSSTLSGNTATGDGGGALYIFGTTDTTNITNSTISGNSARFGGAIATYYGTLDISHSTITGNTDTSVDGSGGLYLYEAVTSLSHTIVSGNSGPGVDEISFSGGSLTLNDYNLLGDSSKNNSDAFSGFAVPVGTDITATSDGTNPTALASILDTTIADNGGPTLTHALVAGSPAIDTGNPVVASPPANDQRGIPFVRQNGTIDIGAYEVQSLALVVDTPDDESDGDYSALNLSLREAIELANANPGADTITFAAALDGGTISMDDGLGEMAIIDAVVIDATALADGLMIDAGNGTDNTFNTADGYRIFNVFDNTPTIIDVELHGLTLVGGDVAERGGAIRNQSENLTVTQSTISGSAATQSGGGIWNLGTLTLDSSTISGNAATTFGGGGIYNEGTATVTSSTISGNTSASYGGGIYNYYGILQVDLSTISGNSASTGGGIANYYGTATINNTIIANSPSGLDVTDSGGGLSGTNNLIEDGSGAGIATVTGDPLLGPLQNNGGPTLTHAISMTSPAFQAGDPGFTTPPDFDQRGSGFARVAGGNVDIGAFELQALPVLVVDTLTDESDGDYTAGDLSLREALELANAFAGADTVTFDGSLSGIINLDIGLGQLEISDDVTVTGLGAGTLTVDAGGNSRVLRITSGTVDISGLTLTDGSAGSGGGIRNDAATTTLTDMVITGNSATALSDAGGGLRNTGDLTLINTTVSNNTALNTNATGGGIWNDNLLTVTGSTISGNTSSFGGAGIINKGGGFLNVTDSTFTGNEGIRGGAIFVDSGTLNLDSSTLSDNTGTNKGGALEIAGTANITNSTISGNTSNHGGAIYGNYGTLDISHSTITGNTATFGGGGLNLYYSTTFLSHTIVSGNSSASEHEIKRNAGSLTLDYNLLGDSSKTNVDAFSGVTPSGTDITATSDGITPTHINSIIHPDLLDLGGPTLTHGLFPVSPALDGGNPAVASPPTYDQRGVGFDRIVDVGVGAIIDIGAFEAQTLPLNGDLNLDGLVDALDFGILAANFGVNGLGYADGNINGDIYVDAADIGLMFAAWTGDAGPVTFAATASGNLATPTPQESRAVGLASESIEVMSDTVGSPLVSLNLSPLVSVTGSTRSSFAAIDERHHQEELLRLDAEQQLGSSELYDAIDGLETSIEKIASQPTEKTDNSAIDEALLRLVEKDEWIGVG